MIRLRISCVLMFVFCLTLTNSALAFESDYISIESQGNGREVILIHGFASSPDVWSSLSKKTSSTHRLHLVSVAGFAGTDAPAKTPESFLTTLRDEIKRYLDEQQIDKPVMIGHSMGGLVSLLVASEYPESIRGVVIVDSLPFFSLIYDPDATADQIAPQAAAFEAQLLGADDEQFDQLALSSAAMLTKTQGKRDLLVTWIKASDRKVYARCFREIMSYDARPKLKNIVCPVTVLHAYDQTMGPEESQVSSLYADAYAELKTARIQKIPESFHFIMWDQPERFHAAVEEALARL